MKEPLLRYIACHRGPAAGGIRTAMATYPSHFRRIPIGALRGCVHRTLGPNMRSVYKIARGHVLEFSIVIRVAYP